MAGMRHNSIQSGFTLLELAVVVLVLAIIAGSVLTSFGPTFIEDKKETATLFEMTQIRNAILQFKQDNPSHILNADNLCSPADASFLLTNEYDTNNDCVTTEATISIWDPDYRIGWQGPYLEKLGHATATSVINIEHDGSLDSELVIADISVVTDPYGNPYYFFDLDDDASSLVRNGDVEPRIVSFGSDGIYDGLKCDPEEEDNSEPSYCSTLNLCNVPDNSDDYILCLR